MKKQLAAFLTACMMSLNFLPALAETVTSGIKDIPNDFWAKQQVESAVSEGIMKVDEAGNFNPDKDMTRVEFVQALLKVLSNDNLDVKVENSFTDIKSTDEFYNDILRSQQLGLVYGYPDKTFQPDKSMLKSETTSVISHITKDKFIDCAILDKYTDHEDVPSWAKIPYAKSINYGIFVNHPDKNKLEPNRNITRAEAAVLLTELKSKLTVVKPEYKGPQESLLSTEHINMVRRAPANKVHITSIRRIVAQNNVFPVAFESAFLSQTASEGDAVNFVFNQPLCTDEGTTIFPAGTKLTAEVATIQCPQKYNKAAKVYLNYKQIILPNGTVYNLDAKTYTRDNSLQESYWLTGLKYLSLVGAFTKGLNYKAKCGERVKVILNEDLSLINPERLNVQQ